MLIATNNWVAKTFYRYLLVPEVQVSQRSLQIEFKYAPEQNERKISPSKHLKIVGIILQIVLHPDK